MTTLWAQLESAIVVFFNPLAGEASFRPSVRNEWPLHRLDHAVYVASVYLVFVVGCKMLLSGNVKPKASEKKAGNASVADKIKQDGFFVFSAMVIYNAIQVCLCGWMVFSTLAEHRHRGFGLVWNPIVSSEEGMAYVLHVFYLSKVLDFADTAFMIVKRNWHQMSFLHIYHHTSVFLIYWLNTQTNFDGDIYFTIVLNSFIHFIMYGYYLVTCFNIRVPMFIKKTITNAQLVQFCCMETQGLLLLLNGPVDGSPRNVTILYMLYISTMLALFLDFKRSTYNAKKNDTKKKEQATEKAKMAAEKVTGGEESDGGSTVASDSERPFHCCSWTTGEQKKNE